MTLLALARSPLSQEQLFALLTAARGVVDEKHAAPMEAFAFSDLRGDAGRHILECAQPFFYSFGHALPTPQEPLRFFHTMLPELILGKHNHLPEARTAEPLPTEAEKRWCAALLAAGCGQDWSDTRHCVRLHALRHLPAYLRAVENWDALLALLTDPDTLFPLEKMSEADPETGAPLAVELILDYTAALLEWPGNPQVDNARKIHEWVQSLIAYATEHRERPEPPRLPPPGLANLAPPLREPRFDRLREWTQCFVRQAHWLGIPGINPLAALLNQASDGLVHTWAHRRLRL
jgi:hypothetical protein